MTSAPDHPVEAPVTGISFLIEWANQQDHWIRALAADIIETRRPVSEARVAVFFDLLLREKELASGEPVVVEKLTAGTATRSNGGPLILTRLEHKENVNARAPNQGIEFNPERPRPRQLQSLWRLSADSLAVVGFRRALRSRYP